MREITSHKTNECNEAIGIIADEPDEQYGNASHAYTIDFTGKDGSPFQFGVDFQRGPIKEVGTNGLTHEVLLAIIIDRLEHFQSGRFACEENADALLHARATLNALKRRTARRVEQGVEGTNLPHVGTD